MEEATPTRAIDKTLKERGSRYGEFTDHAALCQALKAVVSDNPGFREMKPDARQAVEVIFDKIARMVNGDPEYDDNWRDIIGYATLVLDRIIRDQQTAGQEEIPFTKYREKVEKEAAKWEDELDYNRIRERESARMHSYTSVLPMGENGRITIPAEMETSLYNEQPDGIKLLYTYVPSKDRYVIQSSFKAPFEKDA